MLSSDIQYTMLLQLKLLSFCCLWHSKNLNVKMSNSQCQMSLFNINYIRFFYSTENICFCFFSHLSVLVFLFSALSSL